MSKVLVCGGRDYGDRAHVFDVLDGIHGTFPITGIIEGGASGADALAREWAGERWIPCVTVRADWRKHGRAAGPKRNQAMIEMGPDIVVAFPGGRGTADMVRRARAAGVRVEEHSRGPGAP